MMARKQTASMIDQYKDTARKSIPHNRTYYIAFIVLLFLPLVFRERVFTLHLFNMILHNIIILMGLVIILGFSKQFSLGQVAFYGIGAYAVANFTRVLGINFFPALLLASVSAAVLSLLIAIPGTRFRGPWLALVTFAFAEIARILFSRLKSLTGGFAGFFNIPRPILFGFKFDNELTYYYLFLIGAIISILYAIRVRHTPVGKKWIAIGDHENLASSIGINPFYQKIFAFMAGSFFAGLAGGLYAGYVNYLSPEMFTINFTLFYLTILVVGGLESVEGGIIAVVAFTVFQNYLRSLYPWDMVLYGLLIIVFINLMPQGVGEMLSSTIRRLVVSRVRRTAPDWKSMEESQ